MIYVLYFIHIICCLFLILVVLLQRGKGADLSVFGGGTTQAAFGARSTATLLHKATVAFFVLFIFTTLSIGIVQRGSNSSSIMSGVEQDAPDTDAAIDTESEALPTATETVPAPAEAGEGEGTEGDDDTADTPPEPSVPDDQN